MEWTSVDVSKPEQIEGSSYSRYVLIWVEYDEAPSTWGTDRFDHVSKTWDEYYGQCLRVTHWADPAGPSTS